MPARSPFTRLCQAAHRPPSSGRADLHLHSTASDGIHRPAQLVDLARRAGLSAIAVTDHDTTAGIAEARFSAVNDVEIISGVEISAEHDGREFHLLGYLFDETDESLQAAFAQLRAMRESRYVEMAERLRRCGLRVDAQIPCITESALGRRHLAMMLYQSGQVGSVREAFHRYLSDGGPACAPKVRLSLEDAIRLVRGAGGVTSAAHPRQDLDLAGLRALADLGLQAVEACYPGFKKSRETNLRGMASTLGLAITAGSDCHGPGDIRRTVGSCTLVAQELADLRSLSAAALFAN